MLERGGIGFKGTAWKRVAPEKRERLTEDHLDT
jgi:hypothetical protein